MTSPTNPLPERMRRYRVEAELRETPDLHQLAQLFIAMALARAENDHAAQVTTSTTPAPGHGDEVDSTTQEAND